MPFSVRVFAPATVSNLGPGFDVLGLALYEPGDIVDAELTGEPGVEITEVSGDGGALSWDPAENVAGVAAAHVLGRLSLAPASGLAAVLRETPGVRLRVHKRMPLQSGLGSSAASSVAGAVAVNELLGRPLSPRELLASAMEGERVAAGSAHADNAAPSLLGGIVLVRSYQPLEVVELPVPASLRLTVVHPHHAVSTAEARALVAAHRFTLAQAVANLGNVASFVTALHRADLELLGRSIDDHLVEPLRAHLIPAYAAVKAAARDAGALGCSISGSGPSVFALAGDDTTARAVGEAMRDTFRTAAGLEAEVWTGAVNTDGAKIVPPS